MYIYIYICITTQAPKAPSAKAADPARRGPGFTGFQTAIPKP